MGENIKIQIAYVGSSAASVRVDTTASGSVGTVSALFTFDETWADLTTRTAIFISRDTIKQVILGDDNTCTVPWEVLKASGLIEVGVVGQNGNKILPTVKTAVRVYKGIRTEGTPSEAPTPNIYEQIVSLMQKAVTAAQSARNDADTGKFNGKDYVLTEADKKEISNKAVDAVAARTLYISVSNGEFYYGSDDASAFNEGEGFEAPDELFEAVELGVGCLQRWNFKGFYADKIFDLNVELTGVDPTSIKFTGYDAESNRFFVGGIAEDSRNAWFEIRNEYLGGGGGLETVYIDSYGDIWSKSGLRGEQLFDAIRSKIGNYRFIFRGVYPDSYKNVDVISYNYNYIRFGYVANSTIYHVGDWTRYSEYVEWQKININDDMPEAPCLVEGTPINMADGSEKAVEDVRCGDIVQSYDVATGAVVPAVVIGAYKTGANREFTAYNFTNGKHLTVYGMHGIYNKRSGVTKDMRELKAKDEIVTLSDGVVQWAAKRTVYFGGEKKRRYNIVTSNNLYFANGILLGSRPYNKLQYVLDREIELSDEIRTAWEADVSVYALHNAVLNNPAFYSEVNDDYVVYAAAKRTIETAKQSLCDTDYKAQKYVEGALDDAEWQEVKAKRAKWREEVNEAEAVVKEKFAIIRATLRKYRGGKSSRAIFEECCTRDNALFDTVKAYFAKGGETE